MAPACNVILEKVPTVFRPDFVENNRICPTKGSQYKRSSKANSVQMPQLGLSVGLFDGSARNGQLYRQLDGKVDHDSRMKRVLGLAAVLLAIASELGTCLSMQTLGVSLSRTCL